MSEFKLTFGRKFFSCILGLAVLMAVYLITLRLQPAAITQTVTITYGAFCMTLVMMYVGGNVWTSWIKSKYFQPGLAKK